MLIKLSLHLSVRGSMLKAAGMVRLSKSVGSKVRESGLVRFRVNDVRFEFT